MTFINTPNIVSATGISDTPARKTADLFELRRVQIFTDIVIYEIGILVPIAICDRCSVDSSHQPAIVTISGHSTNGVALTDRASFTCKTHQATVRITSTHRTGSIALANRGVTQITH